MGVLVQYTGKKATSALGVDIPPTFAHLDLDGDPVELPDDVADRLVADHPQAFKKVEPPKTPKPSKGSKSSAADEEGDK